MAQQRFVETPSRLLGIGQKLAIGSAGALAVYVAYYPSDSIAVENGDGLWLAVLAIAWMTLVAAVSWPRVNSIGQSGLEWIDIAAGSLATWMMVAAFLNSGQSDLRMGTNEAWWWATAAALFIAARRTFCLRSVRQAFLLLTVCITLGLAIDALHQDWISLPTTRASYVADPDAVIASMGLDAPPGSSTRMILENRLMDGGPTATFALANSLAAVLLLGVVAVAGGLRFGWTNLCGRSKAALFACLVVLVPALVAVRSRSALIAAILGSLMLWMINKESKRTESSDTRTLFETTAVGKLRDLMRGKAVAWALGFIGILAGGTLSLAMFGNPEWIGQAPASLAFRLQYWAATLRMMMDHPLLGAGPGNFQSLYDRYRAISTTEQIADPHNFLLETLAAGGPIALLLLLAIFVLGFKAMGRRRDGDESKEIASSSDARVVLIGGAVMLGVIWFLGLLTLHTPDFSSHRFAIPVAIGLGWLIRSVFSKLQERQLDQIYGVGFAVMMVHLLVSGGWTVPGVAFWVWLLLAGLTRLPVGSPTAELSSKRSGWVALIGLVGLLLLTFLSIRPVTQQTWLMSLADASLRQGNVGKSTRVLKEAVDADPWSTKALMLQSEVLHREIIRQKNRSTARKTYEQCTEAIGERSGPNPTIDRQLATQRLHLYQVFGKTDDLENAQRLLRSAWLGSPANQWVVAQLAEIAIVKKSQDAAKLAERAEVLSQLGNNLERALHLQLLYIAEPIGDQAALKPVRKPASERLSLDGL